jgi:hypothetical protein
MATTIVGTSLRLNAIPSAPSASIDANVANANANVANANANGNYGIWLASLSTACRLTGISTTLSTFSSGNALLLVRFRCTAIAKARRVYGTSNGDEADFVRWRRRRRLCHANTNNGEANGTASNANGWQNISNRDDKKAGANVSRKSEKYKLFSIADSIASLFTFIHYNFITDSDMPLSFSEYSEFVFF